MKLHEIPPEVAHQICDHLGKKDIQNLRLSCRYWGDIAACHLFRSVTLSFTITSFKRLQTISDDTRFRRGVEHLVYEPHVLKDRTRDEWEDSIYANAACRIQRNDPDIYSKQDLDNVWAVYQKYLQEQKSLSGTDSACSNICEIIRKLPMLKKVSLQCDLDRSRTWPDRREECLGWTPHLKPALPQAPLWKQDWSWSPGPCQDEITKLYGEALAHICKEAEISDFIGTPSILSFLLAFHRSCTKLEEMNLGPLGWVMLYETEETFEKIRDIMRPLDRLSLCSNNHVDVHSAITPRPRPFMTQERLGQLLVAASNLTFLDISSHVEGRTSSMVDFGAVVQNIHWLRLHTLKLRRVTLYEDDWVHFLQRHAATLRRLSMDCACIRAGAWANMFRRMRGCLQLEKVVLAGRWWADVPRQPSFDLDPSHQYQLGGTLTEKTPYDLECWHNSHRWALQGYLLHHGDEDPSIDLRWLLEQW